MGGSLLVVRAGDQLCGLPASSIIETMRLGRLHGLADMPGFVRGVAMIRGRVTPVLDLARLIVGTAGSGARAVTVTTDEGVVALAVDEVVGVRSAAALAAPSLPPLLRGAAPDVVDALAQLDGELLAVLSRSVRLPDEVWAAVEAVEPGTFESEAS